MEPLPTAWRVSVSRQGFTRKFRAQSSMRSAPSDSEGSFLASPRFHFETYHAQLRMRAAPTDSAR
jgi:hypothetical protein